MRDMEIIREMGANTIRLAHYQHAQEFYDLCDENGIIVWAEIPYITMHMSGGRENTLSQMRNWLSRIITIRRLSAGDFLMRSQQQAQ